MFRELVLLSAVVAAVSAMGVPIQADCPEDVKCPDGYKLFAKRKNGPWCMKVFPGNLTWWEAESECRCSTKGAHLSGIESSSEKIYVEEAAQEMFTNLSISNGAIWMGAYRRRECPTDNVTAWDNNTLCSDEKLFQFTDKSTCGTYAFQNWATGEPSNAAGDDCGALLVSTDASGTTADNSGKTTDENCVNYLGAGFVCGVPATVVSGGSYYGGQTIIIGAGKPERH